MYFNQRNMMYFPGGARDDIASLTDVMPQIIAASSEPGIDFQTWYWPPSTPKKPVIVFFHGNAQGYKAELDNLLSYHIDHGYGLFYIDYRGYGGVAGQPSENGLYVDARAQINALMRDTGLTSDDMVFYGHSMGSGVATQMAVEFTPRAIIYEGAFSATLDIAKGRFPYIPVTYLMKDKFLNRDKMGALTMPKLFLHGQKDTVVPMKFGKQLFDSAPDIKYWTLFPEGGHSDLYSFDARTSILEFLKGL